MNACGECIHINTTKFVLKTVQRIWTKLAFLDIERKNDGKKIQYRKIINADGQTNEQGEKRWMDKQQEAVSKQNEKKITKPYYARIHLRAYMGL